MHKQTELRDCLDEIIATNPLGRSDRITSPRKTSSDNLIRTANKGRKTSRLAPEGTHSAPESTPIFEGAVFTGSLGFKPDFCELGTVFGIVKGSIQQSLRPISSTTMNLLPTLLAEEPKTNSSLRVRGSQAGPSDARTGFEGTCAVHIFNQDNRHLEYKFIIKWKDHQLCYNV
jgi:hypothetical protein